MNYNYSSYDKFDKMLNGEFVLGYRYTKDMLGSCNGLVCFGGTRFLAGSEKTFLICNPITGQVVYIPEHKEIGKNCSSISGFGYCHTTNEYKIVNMHYQKYSSKYHVLVYTMGSGEWRSKESIYIWSLGSEGIYANGALHWLVGIDRILAFDLEDENFQFLPLPILNDVTFKHRPKLHASKNKDLPKLLGGNNLYLVYTLHEKHCTDIWAYNRTNTNTTSDCVNMKANYNDTNLWHWIKEFSVTWKEPYREDTKFFEPMAITRNDELLLRLQGTDSLPL